MCGFTTSAILTPVGSVPPSTITLTSAGKALAPTVMEHSVCFVIRVSFRAMRYHSASQPSPNILNVNHGLKVIGVATKPITAEMIEDIARSHRASVPLVHLPVACVATVIASACVQPARTELRPVLWDRTIAVIHCIDANVTKGQRVSPLLPTRIVHRAPATPRRWLLAVFDDADVWVRLGTHGELTFRCATPEAVGAALGHFCR